MFSADFIHSDTYNWLVLPLLIFCSRTCDVTLATLRNIFLSRNIKKIVPVIGFFEVLIWLLAVSSIIKNLNNVMCYIAFAGGYSMGIFVGIRIEERLALGMQLVRVITNKSNKALIDALHSANLGVTEIDAQGSMGPVKVLLIIIKRKDMANVIEMVNLHHGSSFFTVEDIRKVEQGIFPMKAGESKLEYFKRIFPVYKSNH